MHSDIVYTDKLEQIGSIIRKTVADSVIDGNHLEMDDVNRFILVGGSCKHPVVSDYLKEIAGRYPLCGA